MDAFVGTRKASRCRDAGARVGAWWRRGAMTAAGSSTCVTARLSVFRHEVEPVVEGEFDAFGEAFSVDGPDQGQMIGEQNALRILGRCDLRRGRSSTFTDVAAHS